MPRRSPSSDPRVEYITAPDGPDYDTVPLEPYRRVYRGSDSERARRYVEHGRPEDITTARPGDFHRDARSRPTAYYTFNERYADRSAGPGGMVIEQRVPSSVLRQGHDFGSEPDPSWRRTVRANREQRPLDGPERRIQRSDVVIGPVSNTSTQSFNNRMRQVGNRRDESPDYRNAFRPEFTDSESGGSDIDERRRGHRYVQQVSFSGDSLNEVSRLPRYARRAYDDERGPANPRIVTIRPGRP